MDTPFYTKLETQFELQKLKKSFASGLHEKPLHIADPVPTEEGGYVLADVGAYSFGTAPAGNYNTAFLSGTTWEIVSVPMPEAIDEILNFQDLTFPVTQFTPAFYLNKYWRVKKDNTATLLDTPSTDPSSKWEIIGDDVLTTSKSTTSVKTDTYTTSQYFSDTDQFAGFAFDYGVWKNFSQAIIKVGQVAASSKPVTEVTIRICETDRNGLQLAKVKKTVTIANGQISDITFDFPKIENALGKNIWVEFWTNGRTGLFKGSATTSVAYRYKSTGMNIDHDFSQSSTAGSNNNIPFYVVFNNVLENIFLKPALVADKVELNNILPVQSNAVAVSLLKYDAVIVDGFETTKADYYGNTSDNVHNSTFVGWGRLLGILKDFNRVGYLYSAFDATLLPTTVTCRIRTVSSTGTIIFEQTKPQVLELNVGKMVYFDIPGGILNNANEEIFVSFSANGRIRLMGGLNTVDYDVAHQVKYSTVVGQTTTPGTVSNFRYRMYCEVLKGTIVKQISGTETNRIRGFELPDIPLPRIFRLFPGFQFTIYNQNVCVPKYGYNLEELRLNWEGTAGYQIKPGFRYNNVPASLNTTITLEITKGREVVQTKSINLISPAAGAGNGKTIDVYVFGDSYVSHIVGYMKDRFTGTGVIINAKGTQVTSGVNHEGRPGWSWNNYYGAGALSYGIQVSGVSTLPTIGAIYSQGSTTYRVTEIDAPGGTGRVTVVINTGSTPPTASGVLTKVSGQGDPTITYSQIVIIPGNPAYNPATGKWDTAYYFSSTGQSINDGGWIIFQLGVNDMFSYKDLPSAEAKAAVVITQINEIVADIHTYNPKIRVGIVIPSQAGDQNAFGASYNLDYLAEMYNKTGLITYQKKLIEIYDNPTKEAENTFLFPTHLNLDTKNNMATVLQAVNSRNPLQELVQQNGVHPGEMGYEQIADVYAAMILYFAGIAV
jgi:lysophospholipase L1-like esterase